MAEALALSLGTAARDRAVGAGLPEGALDAITDPIVNPSLSFEVRARRRRP